MTYGNIKTSTPILEPTVNIIHMNHGGDHTGINLYVYHMKNIQHQLWKILGTLWNQMKKINQ